MLLYFEYGHKSHGTLRQYRGLVPTKTSCPLSRPLPTPRMALDPGIRYFRLSAYPPRYPPPTWPTPSLFQAHPSAAAPLVHLPRPLTLSSLFQSPPSAVLHPSSNLLVPIRWPLSRNLRPSLLTLSQPIRRDISLISLILTLLNTWLTIASNTTAPSRHGLPSRTAHRTARPPLPHTPSVITPTSSVPVLLRPARRLGTSDLRVASSRSPLPLSIGHRRPSPTSPIPFYVIALQTLVSPVFRWSRVPSRLPTFLASIRRPIPNSHPPILQT